VDVINVATNSTKTIKIYKSSDHAYPDLSGDNIDTCPQKGLPSLDYGINKPHI